MLQRLATIFGGEKSAKPLGYAPIDYKRGKITKNEYRSRCLGYGFRIPPGYVMHDDGQLERSSTSENIADLWGQLPSGVNCGVNFVPHDGSVKPEEINLDMFGQAMAEQTNAMMSDRHAAYLGQETFIGYPCAHSMIELDRNGIRFYNEFYCYFSPYGMLQFGFTYTAEMMEDAELLKKSFYRL